MHNLYLFNPDNDIALASNLANFTAPPHAVQIGCDLCTLPYFIAEMGDYVLVQNERQKKWIANMEELLNREIKGVCSDEIASLQISGVCPWGWSRNVKHRLLRLGVSEELMPTDDALAQIRHAASRERTIDIFNKLHENRTLFDSGTGVCAECPTRCDNFSQVKSFIDTHSGTVLKSPWSSSGKGIYIPNSQNERPMQLWCNGVIKRQGMIIAEPLYEKVLDFAMEFSVCRGVKTRFAGYSVFCNDTHNSFDYGIVARDLELGTIICREACVSHEWLKDLSSELCEIIHNMVGDVYNGYVGVDMMVCVGTDGIRFINPCVEMNLRCTMGVLANRIAKLDFGGECVSWGGSPNDVRKKFIVRYYQSKEEYEAAADRIVAGGGIILNAIDENTRFIAAIM